MRVAPFGATRGFQFYTSPWCWLAKLVTHPSTGLMGAGDAAGRRTPDPRPQWLTPPPIGRFGRWGRCSGPAGSPTILLRHRRHGSRSQGRTADHCRRRSGRAVGYTPSWPTLPPGWTRSQVSSEWRCFRSTRCTFCTHSLFSVPAGLYSMAWRLFACHGDLPIEGLPPVVELPMDAFRVQRSIRTVPRADHVSHLEGVTPSVWQATPRKRVEKAAEGRRDLAC